MSKPFTKTKLFAFVKEWGLLLAIVVAAFAWQGRNMLDTDGSVTVAPINLVNLEGNVSPLDAQGKKTLVYFFAPWCNICAISIGSLAKLEGEDLNIKVVALDYSSQEEVQAFVRDHEVNNEVLLGTQQVKSRYQVSGYPTYYLLNENNQIVARSMGFNTSIGIKLQNWLSG